MKLNRLLQGLLCPLAALVSTAGAQQAETFDPTSPSPEIIQQEDAIRGLDRLKQLEKDLARVNQEMQKLRTDLRDRTDELARERELKAVELQRKEAELTRERERAAAELRLKDEELTAIRDESQRKQALRDALPMFRLVGMVQTPLNSIAVIEAGERAYRIRDNQQFLLELSTGAKVQATFSIKSADAVELTIPELSLTELVFFQPPVN